jgi:hypothetical protein
MSSNSEFISDLDNGNVDFEQWLGRVDLSSEIDRVHTFPKTNSLAKWTWETVTVNLAKYPSKWYSIPPTSHG